MTHFPLCLYLIFTILHLLLPHHHLPGLPLLQACHGCSKLVLSWPWCFCGLQGTLLESMLWLQAQFSSLNKSLASSFCLFYSLSSLTGISPNHIGSSKTLGLQGFSTVEPLFQVKQGQVSDYLHHDQLIHSNGHIVLHIKSFICGIKIFGLGKSNSTSWKSAEVSFQANQFSSGLWKLKYLERLRKPSRLLVSFFLWFILILLLPYAQLWLPGTHSPKSASLTLRAFLVPLLVSFSIQFTHFPFKITFHLLHCPAWNTQPHDL